MMETCKSDNQLAELEKDLCLLNVVLDAMPDIVYFRDGSGKWLQANSYALKLFGLETVAYKGKEDSELVKYSSSYREAFPSRKENDNAAWQRGSIYQTREEMQLPDGTTRTFDLSRIPLFHEDGSRKGLVVIGRDISAQRQYQEELERLNRTFAEAQRVAKIGHWLWDIKSGAIEWSDEVFRIFGFLPGEFTPTYDKFMQCVHPDDRQLVKDTVTATLETGKKYIVEHGITLPEGSWRSVREEGRLFFDANNEPDYMLGVVLDTTELKSIEKELDLATSLLENTVEGVAITDQDANIVMVNQAFTEITGYEASEVINKKPSILKSDRQEKSFYIAMWQEINRNGKWSGEIWNRRKNGEVYPEWLTIIEIKDGYGKPFRYVSIFHDLTEIKSHQETIKIKEYHDPLTGLANRKFFMENLEKTINMMKPDEELVLISLDIDDFKRINDSLGHRIGDNLLQDVASRLQELLPKEYTIARLGGDEFSILLQGDGIVARSVEVADAILKDIARPFPIEDDQVILTASAGISIFPLDGREGQKLFKNAELAMYEAKTTGNVNKYFRKEFDEKARKRLKVENGLRQALQSESGLVLYYQPKVELRTNCITGMEALVRWARPDGTMISPADFIPLAEETGLILNLGDWVLRRALSTLQKWYREGFVTTVAVNISPLQFRDEMLLGRIVSALRDSGLPPDRLELEITESAVVEREKEAIATLSKLQEAGIRISLDDFGTGYSSLYYLKKLPINNIKIDKSFIEDLPAHKDSAAITTAIINIARSLDLKVIAEGVEQEEQLQFLADNGCDLIQGYYFSPPVPEDKMDALLRKNAPVGTTLENMTKHYV